MHQLCYLQTQMVSIELPYLSSLSKIKLKIGTIKISRQLFKSFKEPFFFFKKVCKVLLNQSFGNTLTLLIMFIMLRNDRNRDLPLFLKISRIKLNVSLLFLFLKISMTSSNFGNIQKLTKSKLRHPLQKVDWEE